MCQTCLVAISELVFDGFPCVIRCAPHSITIERTFGQMVNRWGILWTPIRARLRKVTAIVQCLLRLHNFGINWDLAHGKTFTFRGQPWSTPVQFQRCSALDPEGQALGDERFATAATDVQEARRIERELQRLRRAATESVISGVSETRERLREAVHGDAHLVRPAHSMQHRDRDVIF